VKSFNPLRIRKVLGRVVWGPPIPFGPDGWRFDRAERTGSVIVTCAPKDGLDWVHASIAYPTHMPGYEDLKTLHRAVFGNGWAYQVFAPPSDHINIHNFALHLFGRLDGKPVLPDFTEGTGSI
jgi:hypothetical protein